MTAPTFPSRLSELPPPAECIIGMIYGDPGVGKSEFLASLNTNRAVLFTDMNGIVTLDRRRNRRVARLYPNFDPYFEIIKPDESAATASAFNKLKDKLDEWFVPSRLSLFDWILVDDMTSTRRNAMFEAVKINGATDKSQTLSKSRAMHDELLPTEADYGTEMGLIDGFIKDLTAACRAHNKNLFIAAHEKQLIIKDKKTREETFRGVAPLFTGKQAPKAILGEFDLAFRMTRAGKGTLAQIKFQCHPDDVVAAKDRYSVFANFEDQLTIPKVFDRINSPISPKV